MSSGKLFEQVLDTNQKHFKMKILTIDYEKLFGATYSRQTEIAKKLNVSQGTVSRWVKGQTRLTLEDLNQIATALGRSTTDFVLEVEVEEDVISS